MADELVKFMLDEVASDGHAGTSISRFISLFSQPHSPACATLPDPSASGQAPEHLAKLTQKHAAWVWKYLAQMEGIFVCLRTTNDSTEIQDLRPAENIDPSLDKPDVEIKTRSVSPQLQEVDPELQSTQEASSSKHRLDSDANRSADIISLIDGADDMLALQELYGDKGVIMRASESRILMALTGEPSRSSKYQRLQEAVLEYVARCRQKGTTVLQITSRVHELEGDPKKSHYTVKILGNMGLIVKLKRTENSTMTNMLLLPKYAENNAFFNLRRDLLMEDDSGRDFAAEADAAPINTVDGLPTLGGTFGKDELRMYSFVRARLTKLLRCNLWHHLLQYATVLEALGYEDTITTHERNTLRRHIHRMRDEGLLEIVDAVNSQGERVRCLRLAEFRPNAPEVFEPEGNPLTDESDLQGRDAEFNIHHTIDYQVLNLVKLADTEGVMIPDLSERLSNITRKIVENVIARHEDCRPPGPVSMYNLTSLREMVHRSRRVRFFTIEAYRRMCEAHEYPIQSNLADVDVANHGEFEKTLDTINRDQLHRLLDSFPLRERNMTPAKLEATKSKAKPIAKATAKLNDSGQPVELSAADLEDAPELETPTKGRPRKFVKVLELSGILASRHPRLRIKVESGFPSVLLHNSTTGVFFPVPDDYVSGPLPEPENWHTASTSEIHGEDGRPMPLPAPFKKPKNKHVPRKADLKRKMDEQAGSVAYPDKPAGQTEKRPKPLPKRKVASTESFPSEQIAMPAENAAENAPAETDAEEFPLDPNLAGLGENPSGRGMSDSDDRQPDAPTAHPAQYGKRHPSASSNDPAPTVAMARSSAIHLETVRLGLNSKRDAAAEAVSTSSEIQRATHSKLPEERRTLRHPPFAKQAASKPRMKTVAPGPRATLDLANRKREALECITEAGGIVVLGMTFSRLLHDWQSRHRSLAVMTDKRTQDRVVDALQTDGEIRVTTVAPGSLSRAIRVASLPHFTTKDIGDFVTTLRKAGKTSQEIETVSSTTDGPGFTRTVPKRIKLSREAFSAVNQSSPQDLMAMSSSTCRELFLQDWRVIPQTYGLLIGTHRRAETLHEFLVSSSSADRQVSLASIIEDLPVGMFCRCFAVTRLDPELQKVCADSVAKHTPLRNLSAALSMTCGAHRRFAQEKITALLTFLIRLGLLRSAIGIKGQPIPDLDATLQIAETAEIRNYGAGEGCPTVTTLPVRDLSEVREYWFRLWQLSSTSGAENDRVAQLVAGLAAADIVPESHAEDSVQMKQELTKMSKWQKDYALTSAQRRLVTYAVHQRAAHLDETELQDLSYRIFAPVPTVEKYARKVQSVVERKQRKEGNEHARRTDKASRGKSQKRRSREEIREAIAQKMRDRQSALEEQWSNMFDSVASELCPDVPDGLEKYLAPMRKDFLRNSGTFNQRKVYLAVQAFLRRQEEGLSRRQRQERRKPEWQIRDGPRTRTVWTAEADELARDAFAILTVRRRRLNDLKGNQQFPVLRQIWPDLNPAKVVARVRKWLKEREAHESYFDRLCMAWSKQVKLHEGRIELPDDNPTSLNDFDLMAHIELLRATVKKGILLRNVGEIREKDRLPPLDSTVSMNQRHGQVVVFEQNDAVKEFWKAVTEAMRETALSRISILEDQLEGPRTSEPAKPLCRTAIKMLLAGPDSTYSQAIGQTLLRCFSKEELGDCIEHLKSPSQFLADRIDHDSFGRGYEMTPTYWSKLARPLSLDLLEDAHELQQDLTEFEDFYEWPLLAKEGEFAAFASHVANFTVDFNVDLTSCLQAFASKGDYSTKSLDDADEEVGIDFRLNHENGRQQRQPVPANIARAEIHPILETVRSHGALGIPYQDLQIHPAQSIREFLGSSIHLVGYEQSRLVHHDFLDDWTVTCQRPDGTSQQLVPKQWFDASGQKVAIIWQRCLGKVYGTITQRPGISESNLRAHLSSVLDRAEMNELLQHLVDRHAVSRTRLRTSDAFGIGDLSIIGTATPESELSIHYLPTSEWISVRSSQG